MHGICWCNISCNPYTSKSFFWKLGKVGFYIVFILIRIKIWKVYKKYMIELYFPNNKRLKVLKTIFDLYRLQEMYCIFYASHHSLVESVWKYAYLFSWSNVWPYEKIKHFKKKLFPMPPGGLYFLMSNESYFHVGYVTQTNPLLLPTFYQIMCKSAPRMEI